MKKILLLFVLLLISPFSPSSANAMEGSWFGMGASYENLSSGPNVEGLAIQAEGGYWYLGNVAYGGYFKANFLSSSIRAYDLGGFWKAATEQGLYGKLLAGVAFMNSDSVRLKVGDGKSFYFGLGGGFLFPMSEGLQIGPEVVYRHLTAGNGGDQVSVGALIAYSF